MNSWIFCLWLTHYLEGLKYFILCLSVCLFSGLFGEADSPSVSYPYVDSTVCLYPLLGFLFYMARCLTPWPFGKIPRSPLRSRGSHFNFLCPVFSEEAPKLSDNLMSISAQAGFYFVRSYWISPLLSLGIWGNPDALFWGCSCGILVPWFPVQQGLQSSWIYWFTIASNFSGGLLPALCFFIMRWRSYQRGVLSSLQRDFFYISLSSYHI